jgi:hypothetical protein
MNNTIRPLPKDVIAYASELLDHGETQIYMEIIRTYSKQTSEEEAAEKNYQAIQNAIDGDMDTNDFDAIVSLCADVLRKGQRLPFELAEFAADVLEGKRSRPTKRGPDPYRDYIRNVVLSYVVEAVATKFGIARYAKGNASNETAADAVSEAAKCSINTVMHALRRNPIDPEIAAIVSSRLGAKLGE